LERLRELERQLEEQKCKYERDMRNKELTTALRERTLKEANRRETKARAKV